MLLLLPSKNGMPKKRAINTSISEVQVLWYLRASAYSLNVWFKSFTNSAYSSSLNLPSNYCRQVAIPLQIYIRERETALGPRGSETRVKLNPKRKNNNFYHLAKKNKFHNCFRQLFANFPFWQNIIEFEISKKSILVTQIFYYDKLERRARERRKMKWKKSE